MPLGVLTYPAHLTCGTQLASEPLVFVFSRGMDTTAIDLSGSPAFASLAGTQTWSTTTLTDDTLTIPPLTTWTAGADLLTFDTADADQNPLIVRYTPRIYTSLNTPALYRYYVSGDAPYRGYSVGPTGLVMTDDGVTLCGGFTTDFLIRDPAAYPTVIASTATSSAGSNTNPFATIVTSGSLTDATALDGFTIVAPGVETVSGFTESGHTSALMVTAALQVRNNKLVAGGPSYSVIALVLGSTPGAQAIFTNNYLKGFTTGGNESYGLFVYDSFPVFDSGYIGSNTYAIQISDSSFMGKTTISNSDIDGGILAGASNFGIRVQNRIVDIFNNREINGGDVGGPGSSYGIHLANGNATISNNLILGGTADNAFGVQIAGTVGVVTITGNTIWGGDGDNGIAIDDAGTGTTVEGNDINGASSATSAIAIRSSGGPATRSYLRNQIIGGLSGGTNTGILLDSTTTGVTVRSNLITGCSDYTGFSLQGPCVAIDNNGATNEITNNTVNGGLGTLVPQSVAGERRLRPSLRSPLPCESATSYPYAPC